MALGRLPGDRFPFALDVARPRAALEAIAERVGAPLEQVASGFLEVAVASMAEAIRRVTIARGHDPRDHALVVFGGAGGNTPVASRGASGSSGSCSTRSPAC